MGAACKRSALGFYRPAEGKLPVSGVATLGHAGACAPVDLEDKKLEERRS